MIVTKYSEVKKVYDYAAEMGWVIPCICTENQTSTEAILAACSSYQKQTGKMVPISIAITTNYDHRSQAPNYSESRDWKTGLKLFLDDIKAFAGEGGVYDNVTVLVHLDHVQYDTDKELWSGDLSEYSSIMFDASALPFEDNIKWTKDFVEKNKGKILIEGACDEIVDATGSVHNELTSPEKAKYYIEQTGVDMIVANLGTEHRATGKELQYHADLANKIREEIGTNIVLHGTSSVTNDQVKTLFTDGVCKVNIWTAIERDSSPVLFESLVKNASKVAGIDMVDKLIKEGYLTEKCRTNEKINIGFFTEMYRNTVIFNKIKQIVTDYLTLWYKI